MVNISYRLQVSIEQRGPLGGIWNDIVQFKDLPIKIGTVFGDVTNNNDNEPSNKKQKFDHVNDESSTWNIHDQEDIWEAIRQYLKASISHDFCLESYHIVKCGYSIKYNLSIPTELLDHVQMC
ncbi:hypothetical protein G6F68_015573 [Rhizopus microsporus]|nr:hypothetical protein G6F68_015573 [Rhizopus microsporus]